MVIFSLLAIILAGCDGCDGTINPPVIVEKFTITGVVNGYGGTINPFSQKVEKGQSATFTISPYYGYEIDYLLDDGYKLPAVNTYTVRDVNKNDTFEVFFKKDSIVWPLINILWSLDSLYAQNPDGSIDRFKKSNWTENYSSNGTYVEIVDGRATVIPYYLDKINLTIKVNTITYKIEKLNESKMILSWPDGLGKWYAIYSNLRYK